MAEIIEPEKSLSPVFAEFFKRQRLAAGHVGLESGQEHHPRRVAGGLDVGDGRAIVPC